MEPHVPERAPGRVRLLDVWVGIWMVIALAGVMGMVGQLFLTPATTPDAQTQNPTIGATSATALPASGTQPGGGAARHPVPVWISAPNAAINGRIVPVGVDAHGNMAAPEGANSDPVWSEAFWWQYGALPGQIGNAVIGGHLDRKDGSPALFWGLSRLAPGDSVYVQTALGATLHFVVKVVRSFTNPAGGAADPVLQRIFGPATTANLNLITCAGDWTGTEFNKKLVVFTTLVP